MKKRVIWLMPISLFMSIFLHATSEFRSPISVIEGQGVIHFPLKPVKNTRWFKEAKFSKNNSDVVQDDERTWYVDIWSAFYCRNADKAFFDCDVNCDGKSKNKSTSKTVSLSTLWFGKECFRGGEAFAEGTLTNPELLTTTNVYLGFARIFPRFDYNEKGVSFGAHMKWDVSQDKRWHVGSRVTVPFVIIEIEQNNSCKIQEKLGDVRGLAAVSGDSNEVDYAYRLDFLSSLRYQEQNGPVTGDIANLVEYGNGSNAANETKIGGLVVTANSPNDETGVPPVYFTKKCNGELPKQPFYKTPSEVVGPLSADGSGGNNNGTLFLKRGTNYKEGLGQDKDAQGELFMVARSNGESNNTLDNCAEAIQDAVEDAICRFGVEESECAVEFLKARCCIDLCAHERIAGLGDLLTEWYAGYGTEKYYADLIIGVRWPTGKKNTDPRQVFFQSTGHNGHFESKLGLAGGWMLYNWFAFDLDASYYHAFERTEKKAAPFKGATVKNIGPIIFTQVSWDYFVGHVNFNFFHPRKQDLGIVLSYELFVKGKDNIKLQCSDNCVPNVTVTDCLDQEGTLNLKLLENRTNSITHKLRGEFFHRWHYCELFAGASYIVGGRNAMQEAEAHLGFGMYF